MVKLKNFTLNFGDALSKTTNNLELKKIFVDFCNIFQKLTLDFELYNQIFTFSIFLDGVLVFFCFYFLYCLFFDKNQSSHLNVVIFWFVIVTFKIMVFFTLTYLDSLLMNSINTLETLSQDLESSFQNETEKSWLSKIKSIFTYKIGSVNVVLTGSVFLIAIGIGFLLGGLFHAPAANIPNPNPEPVVDVVFPLAAAAAVEAPLQNNQVPPLPREHVRFPVPEIGAGIDLPAFLPVPGQAFVPAPNAIPAIEGYNYFLTILASSLINAKLITQPELRTVVQECNNDRSRAMNVLLFCLQAQLADVRKLLFREIIGDNDRFQINKANL